MRRWLHALLVSATACSLEHPISSWDAGSVDIPIAVDAVDAQTDDTPDVVAPDVVDVVAPDTQTVDVIDAGAPEDITDVPSAEDVLDVPAPQDVPDVLPPVDVVDAPPAVDVVDVPPAVDVVDVPPALDVVDVPAPRDVVDVPAPQDVPSVTYTQVSSDTQTTARLGNLNGLGTVMRCAAGEVLVGVQVHHNDYVNGLAARCAPLRANGTLGEVRQTFYWGELIGGRTTDDCPAGTVVVGLAARADRVVNQLALQCAPLSAWLPGRMVTATTPARGGGGGGAVTLPCDAGYVGFGLEFDAAVIFDWGSRVARLRLACVRVNRQP